MRSISTILAAFILIVAMSSAFAAGGPDREIVRVNGTPIRQTEILERLWRRYGPQTLEEMVDELLLRQAAQNKKLKPDNAEGDRRFGELKSRFPDEKVFAAQLESAGTNPSQVKSDISEQLVRERLVAVERKLSVKDDELKDAFTANKDELGRPEAVHLRHILLKSKQEAEALAAQIEKGADFKKLAAEKSLAPTGKVNGGDYGFVTRGMLPPEIESVAFSLKDGELKILESGKGAHLLQAVARRKAEPASFDKVKEQLRELVMQQKIKAALPAYLRELREKAEIKPIGS